ncbi:hypothetical protein [Microbacterium sp.]|uniref:hypothetical protein n=1 Tax=Microbacterium sp. TaxID=51671 RepID=UPI002811D5ED|nr:hypothetical protein [Microbacterium sp.]
MLIIAIAAAMWGAFDSMTDAGGDRFGGTLAIASPALYAGWCMLEPALRRGADVGSVIMRLMTACFIAPGLVAVPVGVVLAVAVIFPGMRDAITDAQTQNGGFHYYWSEGITAQVFLLPLMGWMTGACAALGVCLILALPILSLRAPNVVASGTHIEKVESSKRDSTSAFVFCGLGSTVLGIVLWVFGDGGNILEFPQGVHRAITTQSQGAFSWDESIWLFGVIFVVLGVLAMAWGCRRALSAPSGAGGG